MEINLFQLLILLLIFFPLIRRILNGMKARTEKAETSEAAENPWESRHDRQSESINRESGRNVASGGQTASGGQSVSRHQQQRGEQTWEDFFEGLEQVLSDDEPKERSPSASSGDTIATSRRQPARQSSGTSQTTHTRGSDTGYRHPSHGPVYRSERKTSSPYTYEENSGAEIGKQADQLSRELTEGENPIYTELDESTEVVITGLKGTKNVKRILGNPEKLRDGILLKEILDPPKSRRFHHPMR